MFGLSKPIFTDPTVHLLTIDGRPDIKAVATVMVAGCIRLASIKLVERNGKLELRTPKKDPPANNRNKKAYDYFFPTNSKARQDLTAILVAEYDRVIRCEDYAKVGRG